MMLKEICGFVSTVAIVFVIMVASVGAVMWVVGTASAQTTETDDAATIKVDGGTLVWGGHSWVPTDSAFVWDADISATPLVIEPIEVGGPVVIVHDITASAWRAAHDIYEGAGEEQDCVPAITIILNNAQRWVDDMGMSLDALEQNIGAVRETLVVAQRDIDAAWGLYVPATGEGSGDAD